MQTVRQRLAKGAVWLAASRILINASTFASTLILARILTPADFGLVALATTILLIMTSVTELSLAQALVRLSDPSDRHYDTAWTLNLLRSLGIAAIVAASAVPVSRFYGDPRLVAVIVVLSIALALSGLINPKVAVFTRNLSFRQDFILGVSQKLTSFVVSVALAFVYRSYWAIVIGTLSAQIVTVAISYGLLRYRPKLSLAAWREFWSFSAWLSVGQVVTTLNYRFDLLAVGLLLGKPALGIYSVGSNLAALPTREATAPVAQTLFPGFARLEGDRARLQKAYASAQTLLCLVGLPVGVGFAAVARPMVECAMGEGWRGVIPIIQVVSLMLALQTMTSALQPLAMALGRTRLLFFRELASLTIRVPLIFGGLILAGLPGLLAARAASGVIWTVINLHHVRELIGTPVHRQLAANGRSLASAAALYLAVMLLQRMIDRLAPAASPLLVLIASVLVGAVVFVAGVAALWIAAGRPDGPEREIMRIADGLLGSRHSDSRPSESGRQS